MANTIYNYQDYKKFIKETIYSWPKKGYGQMRRLALHLKVHSTLVSQILNGPKHLTLEQSCLLAEFLGLNDDEGEYLVALVGMERAGNPLLKKVMLRRIRQLHANASKLSNRMPKDKEMGEDEKAIFYTDWYYSGIRLLASIPGFDSIVTIANRLQLTKSLVARAVEFLLGAGLLESNDGRLKMGHSRTHLSAESPFIVNHHRAWRLKSLDRAGRLKPFELMYTAPVTISIADAYRLREELIATIERIGKSVVKSNPEELFCFGIDFVSF